MTRLDRTIRRDVPHGERAMDAHSIAKWRSLGRDVPAAPQVVNHAMRLVPATQTSREHSRDFVNRCVRYGSSPRGAQALMRSGKVNALRAGRLNVSFDDVRAAALPALRHRILLDFTAEAENMTSDPIAADGPAQRDTQAEVA